MAAPRPRPGKKEKRKVIGRMAARHLLEQGHREFAFFGISQRGYSLGRWAGFFVELRRAGFQARRYKPFIKHPQPKVKPLIFVDNELSVTEVVAQTGYCRRILEAKFKQAFGRTIFQEIRHVQLEESKRLLKETAESTGWGTASHFGVEFKKLTGISPGAYRKRMR